MFTSYADALDWIHSRLKLGIKPGLRRMEWMMERLGHPERNIKSIHVGGTNGKGSTVSYMRAVLQEAGYQVGTFTSPYIEQFNERISVNGVPITNEEMVTLANQIKPLVEELEQTDLGSPTEFEVITAMSFYYFGKLNPVDFVLYEVGLGGRFDSTNIIHPVLSVITTIGLDHMAILGDTIEQISFEKAGIIKSGVPIIAGVQQEEAIEVIAKTANQKMARLYLVNREFSVLNCQSTAEGEFFTYQSERTTYEDLFITMKGSHQVLNASLAVKAIEYLNTYLSVQVDEVHIRAGLEKMYWIGRFEKIQDKPTVIIDGAHNREGIRELVKTVNVHLVNQPITVIFSALEDKPLDEMVTQLDEIAESIIYTSFDFPRATSAEKLYSMQPLEKAKAVEDFKEAIDEELTNIDHVIVITGSLYFISQVRQYLKEINKKENM
ncbi:dihydrofolate synthase/folylpolyglutamate synthase [Bacillus mesophilus]|uniref:Dihydrofolate synthase/folylpolyglutamate synthase n=1 Tax=Bacillus mesophilus TaxID=1808955 RepID=A0A6M0Q688_9BACI|nr:folylpolyglutamate synthase/dihydrofolate synthase family protein [Bacillus mesophilus]MBM7660649.1 dihydrofolate synthase/folylpolyglutamate synthase [Bacillus mesophilus]NEY71803.1 bifunctional folylpolyglutamate synthase/dihydrofolate synthase [Bacillus mesophilus]